MGEPPLTKPTMADVARRAGVDVSTVSRALNPRTSAMLRPETVERIVAASEALGYRPNVIARGLRTQRSHTLGIFVPDINNAFFPPIMRGLADVLEADGYTLLIANTDNDPERQERGLSGFAARQIDGLFLATSRLDTASSQQRAGGIPVVLVNRHDGDPTRSFVVPDDADGVRRVIGHLVALGHERIGHVAGPDRTSTGRTRRDEFQRAVREAGLADDAVVEAERFRVDDGTGAAVRLLEAHPDVTAIFAANDLLAVGVLRAGRERGITVPDDLSLVGFNDMPLVDLIDPPLTTVRVPQYEMGTAAAQVMLRLLEARPTAPTAEDEERLDHVEQLRLETTLVVRRSTAPPREDTRRSAR